MIEEWVLLRWMTLVEWYPARFLPSQPLDVSHLTYVYGNLKKKCWSTGQHICPKDNHQCTRIICSSAQLPPIIKNSQRLAARASRVLRQNDPEHTFQLWDQAQAPAAIFSKLDKLVVLSQYEQVCPCTRKKPTKLSIVQLDASGFYNHCDVQRGLKRLKANISRAQHRSTHSIPSRDIDGITVMK